jgi:two-component system chemotaxis sensor kinase CheA
MQKLDTLLARSGELLVARRRTVDRQEDATRLRAAIQRQRAEWRRIEKPLRRLLESSHPGDRGASQASPRVIAAFDRIGQDLKALERAADAFTSRLAADHRAVDQAAAPLEEDIRRLRMLPFGDACEGMQRVARDLARTAGKDVELVLEGGTVEVGGVVLDQLKDPLLHLLRNALDHGVETPDERRTAGKPSRATVTVAATLRGNDVEIVVADDGRGLNLAAVQEQASRRRLPRPEDDQQAARLIFLPGFSTASLVTEVSGLGIGLDVV